MSSYFSLFPLTEYQGKTCVDLTRRVAIRRAITSNPKAYQPYDVPAGTRADQVADGYYGSSEREWLAYLSCGVLDPYFDWYASDAQFNAHIDAKYGSIQRALSRVHHWQLSWTGPELDPSGYEDLPDPLKKYYQPRIDQLGNPLDYHVREDDLTLRTNMIVTVQVNNANDFIVDEVVRTDHTSEVAWANDTHLVLRSVQGDTSPGLTITGDDSKASATIVSRTYTQNTIPEDERVYWEPVTMWDWENDRNESRKTIHLIRSDYVNQIETETKRLLSE